MFDNTISHYTKEGGRGVGLPMFFCLYIAQSIPSSFFATALQVIVSRRDIPEDKDSSSIGNRLHSDSG